MSAFVDASVLVAILGPEADGPAFAAAVLMEPTLLWSAVARWEAVLALSRAPGQTPATVGARLDAFAREMRLNMVPIGEREAQLATVAYATYGKRRHPAQLNMGDCFAYACTKAHGARLLYKGDDFSQTDLA